MNLLRSKMVGFMPKLVVVPALVLLFLFGTAHLQTLIDGNWSHNDGTCDLKCRAAKVELFNEVGWIGENLYRGGSCDIREVMRLWEESPTHKEVLDSDYKYGVMLIYKDLDYCYITLDVGNK